MGNHREQALEHECWTASVLAGVLLLYTSIWELVYHSTRHNRGVANNSESMTLLITLLISSSPASPHHLPQAYRVYLIRKLRVQEKVRFTAVLVIQMHSKLVILDWPLQIPLILHSLKLFSALFYTTFSCS